MVEQNYSVSQVVSDMPPNVSNKRAPKVKPAGVSAQKHPRIKVRSEKRATLSPRETTEITGFGLAHTYTLLRDGTMPSIRVGKQFFVPHSALMEWLKTCGQASAKTA
jgi:excisionase family DNA binding protein